MKFTVTLTMTVEADSQDDACEIGTGAAEHLHGTFNDDDSISPYFDVQVKAQEMHS